MEDETELYLCCFRRKLDEHAIQKNKLKRRKQAIKYLKKDNNIYDFTKKESKLRLVIEYILAIALIIMGAIYIMFKICPSVLDHYDDDGITVYGESKEFLMWIGPVLQKFVIEILEFPKTI